MSFRPASLILSIAAIALGTSAEAGQAPHRSLPDRARSAEHVVVATVVKVDPVFQRNEFGDELIVSRTLLQIEEVLKGKAAREVVLEVEGGTIGGLTLNVSDLPKMRVGDRGVFFAARGASGALVPSARGHGIMFLDTANRVKGSTTTLDDVRAGVAAAR